MSAERCVLLVDDDTALLRLLTIRLESAGYRVATATDGEQALASIAVQRPRAVITDLRMEGMDGMHLFHRINSQDPALPVIILTAHGTIPDAVKATQQGVFGYLTKPFKDEELLELLEKALTNAGAEPGQSQQLNESWRDAIITASPALEGLLAEARLTAESDASVLIQGESGTGKEVLANAIHRASPRSDRPFTAINCAAIPEQLLESELFGHVKGAFTGATSNHQGLFESAAGGTVFLDEIGDMPLGLQAKLLKVLEDREIRPIGSNRMTPIDVRIIAATHRDLEAYITDGAFREDLYYRLNVVTLELPPLRSRREDIPLLARHFLSQFTQDKDQRINDFTPQAMQRLSAYHWPGNVRQLRNVVQQCSVLCTTSLISEGLVERALREKPSSILPYAEAKRHFDREYLIELLKLTDGRVSKAAELAGRNRTEFYRLLERNHLNPAMFKPHEPSG